MVPDELKQQALSLIKQAKKILVVPSIPIDCDCLGSTLALYKGLKKLDKEVTAVCADTIPETYKFLPQIEVLARDISFSKDFIITIDSKEIKVDKIRHEMIQDKINIIVTPLSGVITPEMVSFARGKPMFDLIITVDGGDLDQFKAVYEANIELFQQVPILNIDHHVSNSGFGKVNYVDVMAPSTTVLITEILESLGGNLIDADIATHLLAGLITDTGSFQNPNTTPDAFAVASDLIERGARQQEIIQHVYKTKRLSTLKLWGRILSKIQYDEAHRFVWSTVTAKDFLDTKSSPEETEGVIDELMGNAPGTEIVILLKQKGDMVTGSVRTISPAIPASMIAEKFGGGGHLQAAGFRFTERTIEEVEKTVIETVRKIQEERLKLNRPS